jgi:tRNA pseudouridine38-40 synthase
VRYFFHLGFNGFNYRGWQRQSQGEGSTIQEVIETILSQMLKKPVSIMGCGRTDAMVHASQFFFHVDIDEKWDYDLKFRINKMLPSDIAIFEIVPVDHNHHARFDATQRAYDYFIHTHKDPFLSPLSALYQEKGWRMDEMKRAVALLPKHNDYRAFCTTPDRHRTTICHVAAANLFADPSGEKLRFTISANRFLSSMIRIIVGKLLEIGRGDLSVDQFEHHLLTKEIHKSFEPAYPQGLYLSRVTYPYLDIAPRIEFSGILRTAVDQWRPI